MQQTIDLTWQEMIGGFQGETGARPTSASILNFRNSVLDQLEAAGGTLRFCVRWDSTTVATTQFRDQVAAALQRNANEWFSKLSGYDCWPYTQPIPVTSRGGRCAIATSLQWTDNSVPVFVNDIRENAPQCAETCGRFFHQQAGYQYPSCTAASPTTTTCRCG